MPFYMPSHGAGTYAVPFVGISRHATRSHGDDAERHVPGPLHREVGLSLAIMLGIVGLGRGIMRHGYMLPAAVGGFGLGMMAGALSLPHDGAGTEAVWTMVGVLTLALGHDLNRRATY